MQKIIAVSFITAVLALPAVLSLSTSASASSPVKAQEEATTRHDEVVPTVAVGKLPSVPVLTAKETVITAPKRVAKVKVAKVYGCTDWQDSQVGGQYKACGWR